MILRILIRIRYNPLIARQTKHLDPQATWRAQETWIWHVRYPRSSTFPNKRPALEGLHDNPIQFVLYICIYIYTVYKCILSSSLHFSLSKLFVSRSNLALRTRYTFFGLLVAFATRTPPQQCVFWKVLVPWSVALNILDDDQTTQLNKKVEYKNPSLLKRTELDKNSLFWWHDFFAQQQQLSAVRLTQLRQWSIDVVRRDLQPCSLAALHGCSMFRFLCPDGLLSGWLGRVLSACYQMRRIRSHLAAAGPLTRWIDEVKGKWQYELITPNDMIPAHCALPIKDGTPKRKQEVKATPALVIILNNHCWCGCYCNWRWGPQRKSSQRSVGWKTCQCLSIGCNSSPFFIFFLRFMSTLLFLLAVLATAYRCWAHFVFMKWFIIEGPSRPDWTKINIAKSKFSMLKSIEMRHPEHPSCKVQLHPAEEQDLEVTFTLEENEEFVGFQFLEAKQGAQKTYNVKIRHCSKKCSIKVPELAQWKNETSLWGQEFGNRSKWVVPSTRFDPHFGEDVYGPTVKTSLLPRSVVPWETSLAPCHGQAYLWWHSRRRRGTGWNWFGKTPLFVECLLKFIKSLSSLENLSESRASQIEVRDCHDLPNSQETICFGHECFAHYAG